MTIGFRHDASPALGGSATLSVTGRRRYEGRRWNQHALPARGVGGQYCSHSKRISVLTPKADIGQLSCRLRCHRLLRPAAPKGNENSSPILNPDFVESRAPVMNNPDHDTLIRAVEDARRILGEYIKPGLPRHQLPGSKTASALPPAGAFSLGRLTVPQTPALLRSLLIRCESGELHFREGRPRCHCAIWRDGERREHRPVADFKLLKDVMEVLFDGTLSN